MRLTLDCHSRWSQARQFQLFREPSLYERGSRIEVYIPRGIIILRLTSARIAGICGVESATFSSRSGQLTARYSPFQYVKVIRRKEEPVTVTAH